MPRRQSIHYGYSDRPPTRILPASYQPELVPMRAGPSHTIIHNNSSRRNRVAPPPVDYYTYKQSNETYEPPPSRISSAHRQPYYSQNNSLRPDDDVGDYYIEPKSCWSEPLCLGLTRLSGTILFGTMILLSAGSIAGLITSVVLYVQDMNTDPQWKILGMVVCSIMLLTVLSTLFIFIFCYYKGHIKNSMNNPRDAFTPNYYYENSYTGPSNRHRSSMVHRRTGNFTPTSYDDEVVRVQDKLTNTEMTNAPLRPRDIQRGVWQGSNAYNGYAYRRVDQPRMTHRVIQALPHEIDRGYTKQHYPAINNVPHTVVHLPEKHARHLKGTEPSYEIVEEVIRRPRKRDSDEYVEIVRVPKKEKLSSRFNKVTVKHVRPNEEPENVDDDFPTDHFYQ